ncbi:hypothetical protein [Nodosilinea sp. FACHB-13]|uniref:hypothetical protein n=1 Tax=Cyanophyceae TaxID=3028117 RepID=UPI001683ED8C|nr:hypothetical protein [Nodosilinea sp. FACHB-13]MBD2108304.1 hypothetical protein [Nodosilinea sp. FACHB-13]
MSSFSVIGRPAIASSQPIVVVERVESPRTVAAPIQNVSEEMRSPLDMGSLPNALTAAVLQDAQEWFNITELMLEMAPDAPTDIGVEVELIEPVTWNECRGDSGPSRPMRGICPDINVSGWRVVVVGQGFSEPLRLVYYIPQGAEVGLWTPQPDGLQSLSEAVRRRILTQVAEEAGISISSLRLFWAEARFFDRSLNTREGTPSCGMDIRSGWAVQIMVDQAISGTSIQQPLWVYHTNITGTDIRLVSQGQWMPPP